MTAIQVEVFAYYCGPESADTLQARFVASADHWCLHHRDGRCRGGAAYCR